MMLAIVVIVIMMMRKTTKGPAPMFNQNEDNDKENGHHHDGDDEDDQEQVGDELDRMQDVALWQGYHITPTFRIQAYLPLRNGWTEAADLRLATVRKEELRWHKSVLMWKGVGGPAVLLG